MAFCCTRNCIWRSKFIGILFTFIPGSLEIFPVHWHLVANPQSLSSSIEASHIIKNQGWHKAQAVLLRAADNRSERRHLPPAYFPFAQSWGGSRAAGPYGKHLLLGSGPVIPSKVSSCIPRSACRRSSYKFSLQPSSTSSALCTRPHRSSLQPPILRIAKPGGANLTEKSPGLFRPLKQTAPARRASFLLQHARYLHCRAVSQTLLSTRIGQRCFSSCSTEAPQHGFTLWSRSSFFRQLCSAISVSETT